MGFMIEPLKHFIKVHSLAVFAVWQRDQGEGTGMVWRSGLQAAYLNLLIVHHYHHEAHIASCLYSYHHFVLSSYAYTNPLIPQQIQGGLIILRISPLKAFFFGKYLKKET